MQTTLQVGESVVHAEYRLAKQMVIFSHGFGVRYDARGIFTDIVAALPKGWGYVLFDYDRFDASSIQLQIVGFQDRLSILAKIKDWAASQNGVEKLSMVGHSMGALTIASLASEGIDALVLLAPPLSLGSRFAASFIKRPGAKHVGDTWTIPRSDGTSTVISDANLAELMNVDAEGELSKLALFRSYTIVLANDDEVLPDEDYTELITMPSVSMFGIDKADHDFTGTARAELVETVVQQLADSVS